MCNILCKELNYSLFWTTVRANKLIGAPQDRRRWFALAVLDETSINIPYIMPQPHNFLVEPCERTTNQISKKEALGRTGLLGNSVMPLVVQIVLNQFNYGSALLFEQLKNVQADSLSLLNKNFITPSNVLTKKSNRAKWKHGCCFSASKDSQLVKYAIPMWDLITKSAILKPPNFESLLIRFQGPIILNNNNYKFPRVKNKAQNNFSWRYCITMLGYTSFFI